MKFHSCSLVKTMLYTCIPNWKTLTKNVWYKYVYRYTPNSIHVESPETPDIVAFGQEPFTFLTENVKIWL